MRKRFLGLSCLLALGLVAGCGDDGDSPGSAACTNFVACGGDPVGTWQVKESCAPKMVAFPGCEGGSLDASGVRVRGNLVLQSDLTYTQALTLNGKLTVILPRACAQALAGGQPMTCTQIGLRFSLGAASQSPGVTVACSGDTVCTCSVSASNVAAAASGTYAVQGGTNLVFRDTDGEVANELAFCVAGKELSTRPTRAGDPRSLVTLFAGSTTLVFTKP